jgi:hypothetical protein
MVTAMKLVTRARVEGLVITLVALGYLWQIRAIPAFYQMPGVPGPAAFPEVLGISLGLAGLWRLVWGARAEQEADDAESAEEPGQVASAEPATGGGARGWIAANGKFVGLWATLLGYFAFMPELGFPLGSALALAAMGRLLGERRWTVLVGGAVAVTAVLYLSFAYGLGVRLPLGVLSFLGK